jgi:[CysO sulfur-carrier protein]-S-L-cysteine hydrolase
MGDVVRVRRAVLENLLSEARSRPAEECCGLLAGRDGVISVVLPARNVLASPTAYEIAPAELFALFRRMRDEHLDHLGIYHSHPRSVNTPSPRDLELAFYPDAAYFILSPLPEAPRPVRAFQIADGRVRELAVEPL